MDTPANLKGPGTARYRHPSAVQAGRGGARVLAGLAILLILLPLLLQRRRAGFGGIAEMQEDRAPDGTPLEHYAG